MGYSTVGVPFKGGTLVPSPDAVLPAFLVPPGGFIQLAGVFPAVPFSGLTLYFQHWLLDSSGPHGFTASNAMLSEVP